MPLVARLTMIPVVIPVVMGVWRVITIRVMRVRIRLTRLTVLSVGVNVQVPLTPLIVNLMFV
jgi:hypothetical protein